MDRWLPGAVESCITLFQGVPNSSHVLKIIPEGKGTLAIREIKVYRPFLTGQGDDHSRSGAIN